MNKSYHLKIYKTALEDVCTVTVYICSVVIYFLIQCSVELLQSLLYWNYSHQNFNFIFWLQISFSIALDSFKTISSFLKLFGFCGFLRVPPTSLFHPSQYLCGIFFCTLPLNRVAHSFLLNSQCTLKLFPVWPYPPSITLTIYTYTWYICMCVCIHTHIYMHEYANNS